MEPMSEYAQLQLHFVDSVQRRYEVIRPIVLLGDRTVAQRAEETQLHPETVRDFTRRFGTRACWGSCLRRRKSSSHVVGRRSPKPWWRNRRRRAMASYAIANSLAQDATAH